MAYFFADKPAGATTHTSLNANERSRVLIDQNDGFVEMLNARLAVDDARPLHVAHRLDRETTGAMVFADDPETAESLRELFATRKVKKTYLFLTDRTHSEKEFTVESMIERRGQDYVSDSDTSEPNAKTFFRLLEQSHGLSLWQAEPHTGKSHQIRLHAAQSGIPLLGDELYEGSDFPALALHSAELKFEAGGEQFHHTSPAPVWFYRRELTEDRHLISWLAAVDRRKRLITSWQNLDRFAGRESLPNDTLRWMHSEGDPLRVEQLGDIYSFSWFRDDGPDDYESKTLQSLTDELGWKNWYLQIRTNRGRSPNESLMTMAHDRIPASWVATENGLKFEFRTSSGLSPGLFLDQRRNRLWVRNHTQAARVLNLFCYTGGFSVAAAKGGASKVVSVDVSKPFLEWVKTNFSLNDLPTEGHEFRAIDSREYLAWAKKKQLTFDLVICDPPSFSRSKSGLFKIEKDFSQLLKQLIEVTAPGGKILFSSNFESWTNQEFEDRARKALAGFPEAKLKAAPSPDWDFEMPGHVRNMKSFVVEV